VAKGQLIRLVGPSQRLLAHRLIDLAPANATVQIAAEVRTNDQNALLWSRLSDISRAKPQGRSHTPEVWKNLLMHACGHAVQFEQGLDGQPFPVGFRSSRLNKKQMGELLEFATAFGNEHGVVWSEPDYREDR
jgi:hypothetical protein